ncbi:ATP-binding protein [Alterinioella nitratireducens]|jgi:Na+/proline symporter/nitrogen-specific signal transduction histidine kinase|uniref:ATP-binding protein n=1 Tax=Alterinioella nitratireducens TaxID=2735915 RepID=UPI001557073F|nr:ATP-binding protein [Alterinioella nitratireducens]
MLSLDGLIAICVLYVLGLFAVAFWAEKRAAEGRAGWLNSPLTYTLSLSIYTTAWTFYGAVGSAARSGLEFMTIYLGPVIVFVGWFWLLRKLVRIGRAQRITSIADMISSRYGKSGGLAALVTVLAVVGTTPYLALQLQSVTLSFSVFAQPGAFGQVGSDVTAIWVAGGMALFTIIFGTRSLDVNERHPGLVSAIALEAIVKLAALLAVGVFVVWGVADGPSDILDRIAESPLAEWQLNGARWVGLTMLSAAAILCLPRMFQVLVVENADERHLATAAWAFPLYLLLMSLFVLPIAVVGLQVLPGANPDLYVLTLPQAMGQEGLALLVFLGGFSSATSMVIIAALALSTMLSNHIIVPIWLRLTAGDDPMSGDMRRVALMARRLSIIGVMALGLIYYRASGGSAALASIGLIAFLGVAQVLPALIGGIFWRGATRAGAGAGIAVGFGIWAWVLLLPNAATSGLMEGMLAGGPFGIGWLRPETPLGITGADPLLLTMVLSLGSNLAMFTLVSLVTFPSPMERLQGAQFVNVFDHSAPAIGWQAGVAAADDLLVMAQRILGTGRAGRLFQEAARAQGRAARLPDPDPDFLKMLERELAGSVGAATAHAMVYQITGGTTVSVQDLLAVADETAQMMEYSSRLERQSQELTRSARQLREANQKLTQLGEQKDAFLSQISHELRTPMTSIRAFSELLKSGDLDEAARARFAGIIHAESLRLTRLLDDLLDLSVLEHGRVSLNESAASLGDVLDRAIHASGVIEAGEGLRILRDVEAERISLWTDPDRLAQVFINILSNARKYCDAEEPELRITVSRLGPHVDVDFIDNGSGIPERQRRLIFEKFTRLETARDAQGAGLGLAISREIMARLGGGLTYVAGHGGAAFRVRLPARALRAA